ncbi:MAG: type I restriction enzyme endonuclease domain-containing protein [Candidatus Competibacteraceae bacterium]
MVNHPSLLRRSLNPPGIKRSAPLRFSKTSGERREAARARMRILVKRILRKYGYPPDLQDAAVQTVLRQAEVLFERWAA